MAEVTRGQQEAQGQPHCSLAGLGLGGGGAACDLEITDCSASNLGQAPRAQAGALWQKESALTSGLFSPAPRGGLKPRDVQWLPRGPKTDPEGGASRTVPGLPSALRADRRVCTTDSE